MERLEAEQLRDKLAAEHPDHQTHSFILSERDGDWTVAKVALPPGLASPGTALDKQLPVHDHAPTDLPGGVSNNAAGL